MGGETSTVRLARDALLVSLIRFGPLVIGLGVFDRRFRTIKIRIFDVAARRIAWVDRTARLPTLHATVGLLSAHPVFATAGAQRLDRAVRAYRCAVPSRLYEWTGKMQSARYVGC